MSFHCLASADSWHLYNDRAVSGASKDTVISYEAYLLFYQKVAAEVSGPPNLNLCGLETFQCVVLCRRNHVEKGPFVHRDNPT